MAFVKLSKVKNVLMLPLVRSQYKRWVFDTNTDDKKTSIQIWINSKS